MTLANYLYYSHSTQSRMYTLGKLRTLDNARMYIGNVSFIYIQDHPILRVSFCKAMTVKY